ncbi:MAG TPA: hypothetical protein VF473_10125 [Cyclobacteriaceae bacterium]
MRKLIVLILVALVGCKSDSSDPTDHLSDKESAKVLWRIVHYAAKLPPAATHETKFKPEFDDYYKAVVADYKWLAIRPNDGQGYYFLFSRPARSITPMSEGIGGIFQLKGDSLVVYDEVFRMWKMPDTTLQVRGKQMFDRMVQGKDLSLYYPRITGDRYIEVPDGRFVYDKQRRLWVDTTAPVLN